MRAVLIAAALAVMCPLAVAHADVDLDSQFADLLADHGVLFNLPLEKMQGQRACRDLASGRDFNGKAAVYDLMRKGSSSYDVALSIVSAALTVYCPDMRY